jgi:hypothetical protein
MAGTVLTQSGFGWHMTELISNISNAVVLASSVTGTAAGIFGMATAPDGAAGEADDAGVDIGVVPHAPNVHSNKHEKTLHGTFFLIIACTPG